MCSTLSRTSSLSGLPSLVPFSINSSIFAFVLSTVVSSTSG
jgi:hypothetical protein